MTIDKEKLKQLLSAQVSLHKVAKETGTIEDENVYLNADDALNEYLDDRGIYIEDVALALLAEIDQIKNEKEVLRDALGDLLALYEDDEGCRNLPAYIAGRAAMAKEAPHG